MKRILVTGGSGFIGTNLIIKLLSDKNNLILNIDKISYCSNLYFLQNNFDNLKTLNHDLLRINKLKKIIYDFAPDLIFHLAAESHVDVSLTNSSSHYENNIKSTLNLLLVLRSALEKKILKPQFKFFYIGTDEIYGDLSLISKRSFNENQCLNPSNPYSASKAAAVLMVKAWQKSFGFPSIIINSVNNFGNFQFIEKFIPRSIMLGINKKSVEVYGNGKNIRTWISVKDHVHAIKFLAKNGEVFKSYNVSTENKFANLDIAKKIVEVLNYKKYETEIKFVKDRIGHDRQYSIDSNKIKKLGWSPICNFDDELIKTIDWYTQKNNLKFFKNIDKHLYRKGLIY